MNASFPKERRLRRKAEFERVFARPIRASGPELRVLARGNRLEAPRLGLAVSKRSVPKAVARNRLKRLARETFRQLQHSLGGVDLVIVPKSSLAELENSSLTALIGEYLLRVADKCRKS